MADRTGERIQAVTASPQVLPESTVVREAAEAMRVNNIGDVIVVSDGGEPGPDPGARRSGGASGAAAKGGDPWRSERSFPHRATTASA
jgi:CBS domain-containing protein